MYKVSEVVVQQSLKKCSVVAGIVDFKGPYTGEFAKMRPFFALSFFAPGSNFSSSRRRLLANSPVCKDLKCIC